MCLVYMCFRKLFFMFPSRPIKYQLKGHAQWRPSLLVNKFSYNVGGVFMGYLEASVVYEPFHLRRVNPRFGQWPLDNTPKKWHSDFHEWETSIKPSQAFYLWPLVLKRNTNHIIRVKADAAFHPIYFWCRCIKVCQGCPCSCTTY